MSLKEVGPLQGLTRRGCKVHLVGADGETLCHHTVEKEGRWWDLCNATRPLHLSVFCRLCVRVVSRLTGGKRERRSRRHATNDRPELRLVREGPVRRGKAS